MDFYLTDSPIPWFLDSSSLSPLFTSRLSSVYVWTRVDPETKEVQA